jgi:ribosomal protein L34E
MMCEAGQRPLHQVPHFHPEELSAFPIAAAAAAESGQAQRCVACERPLGAFLLRRTLQQ